ncbi:MAG: universal stress protein [Alphaproteobacteria bacterium]|nr:universal stress protein [Alphaproteobacteria bacterium]
MSYKTLLVPVSDATAVAAAAEPALALAGRWKAHVSVLHARPSPESYAAFAAEGVSAVMVEDLIRSARKEMDARAGQAKSAFESVVKKAGIATGKARPDAATAAWLDAEGDAYDVVVKHGRAADLIVAARPANATGAYPMTVDEFTLFDVARPVLLLPTKMPATVGTRVAIAWNNSANAAHAVAGAMPFLLDAKAVTVIAPPDGDGGLLGEALQRHGIAVQPPVRFDAVPAQAGDKLLAEAQRLGADLLVMGAYGHSRMREMILGGATRHILHEAKLPVLIMH